MSALNPSSMIDSSISSTETTTRCFFLALSSSSSPVWKASASLSLDASGNPGINSPPAIAPASEFNESELLVLDPAGGLGSDVAVVGGIKEDGGEYDEEGDIELELPVRRSADAERTKDENDLRDVLRPLASLTSPISSNLPVVPHSHYLSNELQKGFQRWP